MSFIDLVADGQNPLRNSLLPGRTGFLAPLLYTGSDSGQLVLGERRELHRSNSQWRRDRARQSSEEPQRRRGTRHGCCWGQSLFATEAKIIWINTCSEPTRHPHTLPNEETSENSQRRWLTSSQERCRNIVTPLFLMKVDERNPVTMAGLNFEDAGHFEMPHVLQTKLRQERWSLLCFSTTQIKHHVVIKFSIWSHFKPSRSLLQAPNSVSMGRIQWMNILSNRQRLVTAPGCATSDAAPSQGCQRETGKGWRSTRSYSVHRIAWFVRLTEYTASGWMPTDCTPLQCRTLKRLEWTRACVVLLEVFPTDIPTDIPLDRFVKHVPRIVHLVVDDSFQRLCSWMRQNKDG